MPITFTCPSTPIVYGAQPVGLGGGSAMTPVARHIRRIDCHYADGHVSWEYLPRFESQLRRSGPSVLR